MSATVPSEKSPESTTPSDDTKAVGRGALYLTFTKFWFLISGYVIVFGLPRLLGAGDVGKALYGKYSVVTSFSAILNAFVIQGTTQAVARFIGKNPVDADGVRRAAFKLQAALGGGLFVLQWVLAPIIARSAYDDPALATPLRYSAFIMLAYAFYAVAAGYLNGTKRFGRQALADFCYSTFKVIGVLSFAWLLKDRLGGVEAPIAGFAAAAVAVMALALILAGPVRGGGFLPVKTLLSYQALTMFFMMLSTFVVQGNVQLLRIHLKDADLIDHLAADLDAAQKFATIPFQAVIAITFVLFPLVSAAAADKEKMRGYIGQTARYATIIAAAIACFFAAVPDRTIHILFTENYAPAARPLPILCAGYLCFSLAYIVSSILTAAGHAGQSVAIMAIMSFTQVACSFLLVDEYRLMGIASSTSIAMAVGVLVGDRLLRRNFGGGLPWGVLAKILGSAVVVGLLSHFLFAKDLVWGGHGLISGISAFSLKGKVVTLVAVAASGIAFIVMMLVTGVLGAEDRAKFKKVLKR